MMFEFTLCDGCPITISADAIQYFQPADEHTMISLRNGSIITVRETYDQVSELFNPERQADC